MATCLVQLSGAILACAHSKLTPEAVARAADGLVVAEERTFDLQDVLGRYYPTNPESPEHVREVYNADGTLDSVVSLSRVGSGDFIATYAYDARGELKRADVLDADGVASYMTFDREGATAFDSAGAVTQRERVSRDAADRPERLTVDYVDGEDYTATWVYGASGRLRVFTQHYAEGRREVLTYSGEAPPELVSEVVIQRRSSNHPPDTTTTTYTYADHDEHGRWRWRESSRNGGPPTHRTYRILTYANAPAPPSTAEVRGLRGRWRSREDSTVVEIGMENGIFTDPDHFAWRYAERFHAEGPVFGIAPGELLFVSRFDVPAQRYGYRRVSEDHIRLSPADSDVVIDLWRD